MTPEEKAKAYDEALERASKLRFQNPFDTVSQMMEHVFPELKESEDERIRKWIIDDIIYNMDNEPLNNSEYKKEAEKAIAWLEKQGQVKESPILQHENKTCKENGNSLTSEDERIRKAIIATIHLYYGEPLEDEAKEMLAWLEKQGNVNALIQEAAEKSYTEGMRVERKRWLEKQGEKPTLPKWRYKEDNTPLLRDSIILNKYGCVAKSPSGAIISDAWVLDYDELAKLPKEEITKQGEQKCIPKYKIGDYVKNTNYKGEPIYEIIYMDKECYICEYRGKERMGDKAVMHFSFDNPYLRLVQKSDDKVEPKFKVKYAGNEYNVFETKDIAGVTFYGIEDEPNHIDYVKAENCEIISVYAIKENGSPYPTKPAVFSEKRPKRMISAEAKEAMYDKPACVGKNDTLLDLLHKMPSYITVDGIFYHFMLRKTALAYTAYYAGEEEGSGKVIIFGVTAFSPIGLLTEMLEKLKNEGLLE